MSELTNETESKGLISYVPVGERESIKLSMGIARRYLVNPTKSGAVPDDKMVMEFLMLCKARGLNPFVGDANLVGYDGKNGPEFSIITAKAALDKRAEINENFDGLESGIVVERNGSVEPLEGAILLSSDILLGAWCRVYRKDKGRPYFHSVNLSSYDKGRSLWNSDKPGMIVKCAEAGALRKAFPNTFSGLVIEEESKSIEVIVEATGGETEKPSGIPAKFRRSLPEKSSAEPAPAQKARVDRDMEAAGLAKEKPKQEAAKPVEKAKPAAKEEAKPEPPVEAEIVEDKQPAQAEAGESDGDAASPSPQHTELDALRTKHGISREEIVNVANVFFGTAIKAWGDLPDVRAAQLVAGFPDVLAQIKS